MKRKHVGLSIAALLLILAAAWGGWRWSRPSATEPSVPSPTNEAAELPSAGGDSARSTPTPATPGGLAPSPNQPQAPAEPEPEAPPKEVAEREWPGVDTDLREAPALYWARVKPEQATLFRKPKRKNPDFNMTLYRGHLIEVLADEGPPLEVDGALVDTKPVRVGDTRGWLPETDFERVDDLGTPAPLSLWAKLRAAVDSELIPEECPVSVLVADFAPERAGLEVLAYSVSGQQCRWAVGVFSGVDASAELLGYYSQPLLIFLGAVELTGARAFVRAQSSWNEGLDYSGLTDYLLAVPPVPGPMVRVFEAMTSLHDNRSQPPKVLLSNLAFPDPAGNGTWLIQWLLTERTASPTQAGEDKSVERFYAFDGTSFVEIPRPEGAIALPPPPPSVVEVP